jgi:hypothetical protein
MIMTPSFLILSAAYLTLPGIDERIPELSLLLFS